MEMVFLRLAILASLAVQFRVPVSSEARLPVAAGIVLEAAKTDGVLPFLDFLSISSIMTAVSLVSGLEPAPGGRAVNVPLNTRSRALINEPN